MDQILQLSAQSASALLASWLETGKIAWDALVDDTDPDTELVRRFLGGDSRGAEALVEHHMRRVYGVCYRFTGAASEAEDLTQQVFVRALSSLPQFQPDKGAFVTWLMQITRHLLIDYYRARSKQDERLAPEGGGTAEDAGRSAWEALHIALQKLSPELQKIVALHDLECFSYSEIANLLGISEMTARQRGQRAYRALGKSLRSLLKQGETAKPDAHSERRRADISGIVPTVAHAVAVFGDERKASHWLSTRLPVLDNRSPSEVLEQGGIEAVERILTRIEHNIPS